MKKAKFLKVPIQLVQALPSLIFKPSFKPLVGLPHLSKSCIQVKKRPKSVVDI